MDKRMYQRIGCFLCILSLILLAIHFITNRAGKMLQKEEQQYLGALYLEDPQREMTYIQILKNKTKDGETKTKEELEEEQKIGEQLDLKYGYTMPSGIGFQLIKQYERMIGGIFLFGAFLGIILLYRCGSNLNKVKQERDRMKEKLDETMVKYEQITKRLEKEGNDTKKLITDISHQLKTPIASLKMNYEITATTSLSEQEKKEFWQKEREEVTRLEMLLESMLNVSKLEAKLIQIQPDYGVLKDTLLKAVNNVYMKGYEKQIDIIVGEISALMVFHDSKWTSEAISNILDNAIKYSPENTVIKITASKMISYVLIEIEDEGIGIPENNTNKIFQRFYRGDEAIVKKQEGSGVGLYLARKIVEEQGGSISVKAARKKGSIFRITLPLERFVEN